MRGVSHANRELNFSFQDFFEIVGGKTGIHSVFFSPMDFDSRMPRNTNSSTAFRPVYLSSGSGRFSILGA